MLKNEAEHWTSNESWIFNTKDDDLIYIENVSKKKVLGATSDGKVIQESIVEDKAEQLWKKGKPNADGYFTLKNSKVPKFITAILESEEGEWKWPLVLRGNITHWPAPPRKN